MSRHFKDKNKNRDINNFDIIEEIELAAAAGCEHDFNDPYYNPFEKEIFYYPKPELIEIAKTELSKIPKGWIRLCSMANDIVQYHDSGGFCISINPNIEVSVDFAENDNGDHDLRNKLISVSDYNDDSEEGLKFFNNMESAIKHISNIRKFLILK